LKLLPSIIALALRAAALTWRVRRVGRGALDEALARGPVVFAFRHGEQLAVLGTHLDLDVAAMASLSKDGALAAAALERLGVACVRGSSSRGGLQAMRAGLTVLRAGRSLALTVDGPRGPAGEPKPGAALVARMARAPICWVRAAPRRALRLRSWDRFEIPWPFTRITLTYGLLSPPPTRDLEPALEALRQALAEPAPRGLASADLAVGLHGGADVADPAEQATAADPEARRDDQPEDAP